mmetsp:Transcript_30538/g.64970  ORF Transcript_30538/g.64970 Transcript_30538/m.64970 type:complete len:395 (+) Transcript_30538:359-1543(+)
MLLDELLNLLHHHHLELPRSVRQFLRDRELHGLVSASHGHRVSVVGGAPSKWLIKEPLPEFLADTDHRQRQHGPSEAFGGSHDVRNDVFEMLEGPEFARTTEAGHDLVQDEEHVVLVAERAHALHIPGGWDQHAPGPDDGLEHDSCDARGALQEDLLLQNLQCQRCSLLVAAAPGETHGLRVEDLHEAIDTLLREPTPEVACCTQRLGRSPMVAPVLREDLLSARIAPGDADGRLVSLGTATGEEEAGDVAWHELRHELREAGANRHDAQPTIDIEAVLHLLSDSLDDRRGHVMAQVATDGLGGPVEILVALAIPKVHALALHNMRQVNGRSAGAPSEHHVVLHCTVEIYLAPFLFPVLLARPSRGSILLQKRQRLLVIGSIAGIHIGEALGTL